MNKIISLIFLFNVLISYGQEVHEKVKGKIITLDEEGAKSAIPNAKIFWSKNRDRTLSNLDGSFEIRAKQLPDTLIIRASGFEPARFQINDFGIDFTFNLSQGLMLNGVEIVGKNIGKEINLISPFHVEKIGSGELRKAACCNLSESFETNASVDVNITDAVSGAKKIQLLGLDGVYTQFQFENIPLIRGLSTSYGLSFIPGTWIESIQITKGTGSVLNGYESIAGSINLELKKSKESERLYINLFGNRFSKTELNIHGAQRINDKLHTVSFLHMSNQFVETDVNSDGFRDAPIGLTTAFLHRWGYDGENYEAKFGFKGTYVDKLGGQLGSTRNDDGSLKWNASFQTEHLELFSKNGFFLKNRPFGSIGIIGQAKYHHMLNHFGNNSYEGTQKKIYINSIYGDIIGNTKHNIKTGISFFIDDYEQSFNDSSFLKTEIAPGIYGEYTFNKRDEFITVIGLRGDYHNLFGPLITPRIHAKWNISKKNALRISAGRGYRIPNPYADNNGLLASNRTWIVDPNIIPEDGVSAGVTFTQKFLIKDNAANFTIDYFYTYFLNQLIIDMDVNTNEFHISNTNMRSFSNSFQAELALKPIKQLALRAAFKYYDVRAAFGGQLQQRVFVPKYRILLNGNYTTRNKKWTIDVTGNWIGRKRLPSTNTNPEEYQRSEISDSFWLLNSQITYKFKRFDLYFGGENILNVIQNNAIIAANDPFGAYFDATQIWAPINGVNLYAGIHLAIKQKKK